MFSNVSSLGLGLVHCGLGLGLENFFGLSLGLSLVVSGLGLGLVPKWPR